MLSLACEILRYLGEKNAYNILLSPYGKKPIDTSIAMLCRIAYQGFHYRRKSQGQLAMAMGIQVNAILCHSYHLIAVDKAAVELGA